MIIVNEDIKPWIMEPATDKQIKFMDAICRVVGQPYTPNPTKIDASVYIDKLSQVYYAKIAKHLREERKAGVTYTMQPVHSHQNVERLAEEECRRQARAFRERGRSASSIYNSPYDEWRKHNRNIEDMSPEERRYDRAMNT